MRATVECEHASFPLCPLVEPGAIRTLRLRHAILRYHSKRVHFSARRRGVGGIGGLRVLNSTRRSEIVRFRVCADATERSRPSVYRRQLVATSITSSCANSSEAFHHVITSYPQLGNMMVRGFPLFPFSCRNQNVLQVFSNARASVYVCARL